jgi:hypothetical protein
MHINNISLNVFSDAERYYIYEINNSGNTTSLIFIESYEKANKSIKDVLTELIEKLPLKPEIFNYVISPDDFVLTQFPHTEHITGDELKEILDFEVKQNFGEVLPEEITCILTPLDDLIIKQDYILASLFKNEIKEELKQIDWISKCEMKFQFSTNTVINSFRFNYPEFDDATIGFFGIYNAYLIYIVISPNGPSLVQFWNYDTKEECNDIIKQELNVLEKTVHNLTNIFIYGEKLDGHLLKSFIESNPGFIIHRLNAFRKLSSGIDERAKEYCARTMHIHSPGIGASLPDYTEHIEFL